MRALRTRKVTTFLLSHVDLRPVLHYAEFALRGFGSISFVAAQASPGAMRRDGSLICRDAFALHLAASWSVFDDNSASSPLGPEQEGKMIKVYLAHHAANSAKRSGGKGAAGARTRARARSGAEIRMELDRIRDLALRITETLDPDGKLGPGAAQRPSEPLPRGGGHAACEQMDVQNPRASRAFPVNFYCADQDRIAETATIQTLPEPVDLPVDAHGGQRSAGIRSEENRRDFVLAGA